MKNLAYSRHDLGDKIPFLGEHILHHAMTRTKEGACRDTNNETKRRALSSRNQCCRQAISRNPVEGAVERGRTRRALVWPPWTREAVGDQCSSTKSAGPVTFLERTCESTHQGMSGARLSFAGALCAGRRLGHGAHLFDMLFYLRDENGELVGFRMPRVHTMPPLSQAPLQAASQAEPKASRE